eukprot:jgi/Hompol1/2863/HPOL_003041-RA
MNFLGKQEQSSLWKSMLEIKKGADEDEEDEQIIEESSLDSAIAIQREFHAAESVRPVVQGILAIKIKSAVVSPEVLADFKCMYCSIVCRNYMIRTFVVPTHTPQLVWEQVKHFPIREVGSVAFHLHEIIKASPVSGNYDIWGKHFEIGQIEIEITFSYGLFGYGSSPQLKDIEIKPEEAIQYSLMPRINPPPENNDPVLIVQAVPHPPFVPFSRKIHLSYGKDIHRELDEISKTMYRPEIIMQDMDMMEQVRQKYYSLSDRALRLAFLHNYLQESSNRPETVTEEKDPIGRQDFPRMTYLRFVAPSTSLAEPPPSDARHLSKYDRDNDIAGLVQSLGNITSKGATNLDLDILNQSDRATHSTRVLQSRQMENEPTPTTPFNIALPKPLEPAAAVVSPGSPIRIKVSGPTDTEVDIQSEIATYQRQTSSPFARFFRSLFNWN